MPPRHKNRHKIEKATVKPFTVLAESEILFRRRRSNDSKTGYFGSMSKFVNPL